MSRDLPVPPPTALPDEPSIYPYTAQAVLPGRAALVFAPHPDDEVFGCGGLIAAWLDAGVQVQVVVVSDGALGGDAATRERESIAAARALAGHADAPAALAFWRLPDRAVRADAALVRRMAVMMVESGADIVLLPSPYEIHPDHRAVCSAGTAAFASAFAPDSAASLAYYEVGHALMANCLIDITPTLARKQTAIDCFASQLAQQDYGEQVLALNRFRSYTLGQRVSHAEAYCVHNAAHASMGLASMLASDAAHLQWRLGLATADGGSADQCLDGTNRPTPGP